LTAVLTAAEGPRVDPSKCVHDLLQKLLLIFRLFASSSG